MKHKKSAAKKPYPFSQLQLGIDREIEPDRNLHLGGRSFYFFDLDDNILVLPTKMVLFHKESHHEILISTTAFAHQQAFIGQRGLYRDYEIRFEDRTGSFRYFRDLPSESPFLQDLESALTREEFHWQGPSWNCFMHATLNQRPTALITARGHEAETFKKGFAYLAEQDLLPYEPNWLAIYPVSNKGIQRILTGEETTNLSPAQLKRRALRASVEEAFSRFGKNPNHRFGISDDDPKNIENLLQELLLLKMEHPKNSFFLIETHHGHFVKREIHRDEVSKAKPLAHEQMSLF